MNKNLPVLVTGCQRSGTTLLYLILDSHPQIRGLDEWECKTVLFDKYLSQLDYHPCVVFKLPKIAHFVPALTSIGVKVLWCLRDPRDVISSMIKLGRPLKGGWKTKTLWSLSKPGKVLQSMMKLQPLRMSVSWAASSQGASHEIRHIVQAFRERKRVPEAHSSSLERYNTISCKHPFRRTHEEEVFLGALCWRLKQDFFYAYCRDNALCHLVQYEKLITQPQEEIRKILTFLNLPWHENVLQHHTLHSGISVGKTENTRPIDGNSVQKWKSVLSATDIKTINSLCADAAVGFYALGAE